MTLSEKTEVESPHAKEVIVERAFVREALKAASSERDLLQALKTAQGYMLNAKIDLETGAPKKTAIATIEGGLKIVAAAIARAEA